jgi:hypothetical protein|tara:strand:- start:9204 stop:10856 length:1653 start_codon:yes stop_codon:yes gene_type:complete
MNFKNLSVVFSTKKVDPYFVELIKSTCGVHKVEVIPIENDGKYSLSEAFNIGLSKATNDIVVFCHDDIKFDTRNWGRRVLNHHKKNKDYGILGVAGTRYMPSSGRWWDDFSKMHGAVYHEHEGKRWLSRYSKDIGNRIDDVVLVDGLFFSIKKNSIKHKFDESFTNFHFYDVGFCFPNYMDGVKIGVHSNIKITHLSIGATNDKWEEARQLFVEKYSTNLPVFMNRKLWKGEKLKILIACLNFNDYTGSELHVYELAKGLAQEGHDVHICSNIGGSISKKIKTYGVTLWSINEPPGFFKGDGKTVLNTAQGQIQTVEGQLYKVKDVKFDVLHLHHKPITEGMLNLYPQASSILCTIHSEVLELEQPVLDERIKKYICIRPEIKKYIEDRFNISEDKTVTIYNPFDETRFKHYPLQKNIKPRILFVGTIDWLRQLTIEDLIEKTKADNKELWIVGKKRADYLDKINEPHVKYFEPTWSVENYIKECHETAGILLGRTTIEGWLCNRPGWIYNVDESGNILDITYNEVPGDMEKFRSTYTINEIIKTYEELL